MKKKRQIFMIQKHEERKYRKTQFETFKKKFGYLIIIELEKTKWG